MPVNTLTSEDGLTATIQVRGRFDFTLRSDFLEGYTAVNATGVRFVVDLSETDYVDSSALGMLLLLREYAGGDMDAVVIRNASVDVRRILTVSNFDKLFTIE